MRQHTNIPTRIYFGLMSISIAFVGLLSSQAVVAEEEEIIEEIVVTATKRGETALLDTSGTINVVTGDDLDYREIRNPEDLRTAVSGVYIDEGSSTPKIAIRGVGFDNFQVQAENGVTTYVDGVIIQRTQGVLAGFLDLAQVEGLADLLEAETEAQRRQALRVLSGAIGQRAEEWRSRLIRAANSLGTRPRWLRTWPFWRSSSHILRAVPRTSASRKVV